MDPEVQGRLSVVQESNSFRGAEIYIFRFYDAVLQ